MFMLFTGDTYYPRGGWWDFRGIFETEEDAQRLAKEQRGDWYQVVEIIVGGVYIVSEGRIDSL